MNPTVNKDLTLSRADQAGSRGVDRRIYLMTDLPPEVVAVTFAKTSRSPEPFDQIAAELSESSSARFHEKWVVGYGHASVAEHAVLSLALENVSILAAKAIEDNRLASYTEKSTRYQVYDPHRVYRPACVMNHPVLGSAYNDLIDRLLGTYKRCSEQALTWLKDNHPKPADKSERAWVTGLRAKACDAMRYMLPTATLTNLGWTVNARALAFAIRKLGGSSLDELREIAAELKVAAQERVPTLLKYCDPDTSRKMAAAAVREFLEGAPGSPARNHAECPPEVRVLRHDPDGLRHLACAVAYAHQPQDWASLERLAERWSRDDMIELLRRSLAGMGRHDPLPRAFEHLDYLVEITIDYGAWRDVQRHRMATQTAQELTPDIGYTTPTLISELGLSAEFEDLLCASASVYDSLKAEFPAAASYALVLAFRKRSLFAWNLREVFHFVRLRGTAHGHAAYREVAIELWRKILTLHPWLGDLVHPLGTDFRP